MWFICPIHLSHVISPQAMLMRQQDRLEGRVQNIDEQLTKLESDKTLMRVQYDTHIVNTYRDAVLNTVSALLCAVILSTLCWNEMTLNLCSGLENEKTM